MDSQVSCEINVKDFGAKGDGRIDDRLAIQKAIDFAKTVGNRVCFPPGNYRVNLTSENPGPIRVDTVALIGPPVTWGFFQTPLRGAVISIESSNPGLYPAFLVGREVEIRNLTFYYPQQVDSPDPKPFAATLKFDVKQDIQFVYIDRCIFINSYDAIDIGYEGQTESGAASHIWITQNGIYGIHRGIYIQFNHEVIHILNNDLTFGVSGGLAKEGLQTYTREKGTAIQYDYGDGINISGNLFFGYCRGIYIPGNNEDTSRKVQLTNISSNWFDQVQYGIFTDFYGTLGMTTITSNRFYTLPAIKQGPPPPPRCYGIYLLGRPDNGIDELTITGNVFGPTSAAHISVDQVSVGGYLQITGNSFFGVHHEVQDPANVTRASISARCPNKNFIISGNLFSGQNDALAVIIWKATSVNITGNSCVGTFPTPPIQVDSSIRQVIVGNLP